MHAISSACSTGMREVALQAVCMCMQAITSATLAGLSDIVAQRIISRGTFNWRRTAALAVSLPPTGWIACLPAPAHTTACLLLHHKKPDMCSILHIKRCCSSIYIPCCSCLVLCGAGPASTTGSSCKSAFSRASVMLHPSSRG